MPRYSNFGQMDDQPLPDGDSYWTGFKSRFQPTYLKPGELYNSGNMRLDKGTAKVRKGLKGLSNDITVTNPPLIVGAVSLVVSKAITSITWAGGTATVTTTGAHGYSTSDRIAISGAVPSGYNGDYSITVTGATTFTYTIANPGSTPATTDLITATILNGGFETAGSAPQPFANWEAVQVGGAITRDTSIVVAGSASCKFGSNSGSNPSRIYISQRVLVPGSTYTLTLQARTGSGSGRAALYSDAGFVAFIGATFTTTFVSRSVTFVATGSELRISVFEPFGGATPDVYVDAVTLTGNMLANKGPRVFNNYSSQVIGSGDYADDSTNTEGIIIASPAASYLYRYGQVSITISYPANEVVALGDPCDIRQYLNKVYMFRGYSTSTAAPAAVTSITRAATTATLTSTASHGRATNDWVLITGASPNGYCGMVQITVTGASTFTYTVSGALATPATGTITFRPVKPPLYWDMNTTTHTWAVVPTGPNAAGAPIISMPAVDWGTIFKSRLVLPWSRDQLILSDVLDAGSYDPSQTQFRILPGTADWIVGAFPYQQARLLVLYRKSVHTIFLDGTTLTVAAAYEVTRNFGCVGRKTVANCGPYIVWLSDIGVVKMEIGNELSLTSTSAPLSDPIHDLIDTINWTYADKAVATFWNNRYYLAVPTGTSSVNNTVLVYNFLNEAWESVDTYPSGYDIVNFHVISYNGTKRIHTVGTFGYVSLLEENEVDQFGAPGALSNYVIPGSLSTRNYLASTYDLKKVRRFQVEVNVTDGDAFTGDYVLSNPDYTLRAISYTSTDTTDATLRATVNRRGVSSRLEFSTTAGRPEFKAVMVEASTSSRSTINFP